MIKMLKVFPRLQAMHWKREHNWNHSLELNGPSTVRSSIPRGGDRDRRPPWKSQPRWKQNEPNRSTTGNSQTSPGVWWRLIAWSLCGKEVLRNEKLTQQDFLTALPCASTQSLHLSVQPTESTFLVRMSHGKTVKRIYHVDWIQEHNQVQ